MLWRSVILKICVYSRLVSDFGVRLQNERATWPLPLPSIRTNYVLSTHARFISACWRIIIEERRDGVPYVHFRFWSAQPEMQWISWSHTVLGCNCENETTHRCGLRVFNQFFGHLTTKERFLAYSFDSCETSVLQSGNRRRIRVQVASTTST